MMPTTWPVDVAQIIAILIRIFCVFQLREQMLTKMTMVLTDSPSNTTQEVQVTAEAVAGLTQISDELSPAAQVLLELVMLI